MSARNFVPTLWADAVQESFDKTFLFRNLSLRDYEGTLRNAGDQVKVSSIAPFTATALNRSSAISYQAVQANSRFLTVDQEYVVPVTHTSIDEIQSSPKLFASVSREMGIAVSKQIETALAALHTDAGAIVTGTTSAPTAIKSSEILGLFTDASVKMSEADVPSQGRVAIIPPWLKGKLNLAQIDKDTNNSDYLLNGYVGRFLGFEVYESNFVAKSGTNWFAPMFFRREESIASVMQFNDFKVIEDKDYVDQFIRAYFVYGVKAMRPESLFTAYISAEAES